LFISSAHQLQPANLESAVLSENHLICF